MVEPTLQSQGKHCRIVAALKMNSTDTTTKLSQNHPRHITYPVPRVISPEGEENSAVSQVILKPSRCHISHTDSLCLAQSLCPVPLFLCITVGANNHSLDSLSAMFH